MNYTREQAEEVFNDLCRFNGFFKGLSDDQKAFLDHKFPNIEEGKWYRSKCQERILMYVTKSKHNCVYGYGINNDLEWREDGNIWFSDCLQDMILATPQEVEERLIEEAKRRGFVKGTKFECLEGWTSGKDDFYNDFIICFEAHSNKLWVDNVSNYSLLIFHNGKWAEIIEQPETELTRTIKKAEKIADKLEKLLSLQRS